MQIDGNAFPIFVMFYTIVLSSTFLLSFFDWVYRFCTCQNCYSSTSEDPLVTETDEDQKEVTTEYVDMEKMGSDTDDSCATDENGEACYVGEPMAVDSYTSPIATSEQTSPEGPLITDDGEEGDAATIEKREIPLTLPTE